MNNRGLIFDGEFSNGKFGRFNLRLYKKFLAVLILALIFWTLNPVLLRDRHPHVKMPD